VSNQDNIAQLKYANFNFDFIIKSLRGDDMCLFYLNKNFGFDPWLRHAAALKLLEKWFATHLGLTRLNELIPMVTCRKYLIYKKLKRLSNI
jgi:hypothetical protein